MDWAVGSSSRRLGLGVCYLGIKWATNVMSEFSS
jgi:hypothetical protein